MFLERVGEVGVAIDGNSYAAEIYSNDDRGATLSSLPSRLRVLAGRAARPSASDVNNILPMDSGVSL